MPAVDREQLHCAIYLYPSDKAAKEGANAGGSGFLVGLPTGVPEYVHIYAVTNKHVLDAGNNVLRINTPDGKSDTLETRPDDWTMAVDDDLAVLNVDLSDKFHFDVIHESSFAKKEDFREKESERDIPFGHGEEVVFIGRLISHDGKVRNRPAVRFGNIAMLPDDEDPVQMPWGKQVAFLVDCRSLSGASGSAALAYLATARQGGVSLLGAGRGILLGVDCGHLPRWATVYDKDKETKTEHYAEMNSGISVVIPAWRLRTLLDSEHLVSIRKDDEKLLKARLEKETATANNIDSAASS